jgi:hypothetical protein
MMIKKISLLFFAALFFLGTSTARADATSILTGAVIGAAVGHVILDNHGDSENRNHSRRGKEIKHRNRQPNISVYERLGRNAPLIGRTIQGSRMRGLAMGYPRNMNSRFSARNYRLNRNHRMRRR